MTVLITGAASGIGLQLALYCTKLNMDIILVDQDKSRLQKIKNDLVSIKKTITLDLSNEENCYLLYEKVKDDEIDFLINNAGFGLFGEFYETSIETEMKMVDLNIRSYHILTKLFLRDMLKRDSGYILNICSSAGFLFAPRMSTYYATKNYITKLTIGISEEIKKVSNNVTITALCPGKVNTDFYVTAKGDIKSSASDGFFVAKKGIDSCFKGKNLVVPGINMKLLLFFKRFISYNLLGKIMYNRHIPRDFRD